MHTHIVRVENSPTRYVARSGQQGERAQEIGAVGISSSAHPGHANSVGIKPWSLAFYKGTLLTAILAAPTVPSISVFPSPMPCILYESLSPLTGGMVRSGYEEWDAPAADLHHQRPGTDPCCPRSCLAPFSRPS